MHNRLADVWFMLLCNYKITIHTLKPKRREHKYVTWRKTKKVFVGRFIDHRSFQYNHDIALISVTITAML